MDHGHDLSYDCAFYIHADDRTITTDAESTIELMQYDHNSTLYGFQADRFIDGHDLSNCSEVRIHYVNTTTGGISNSDVYIVTDLSVGGWTGSEDEHVKFSWLVSNNATQYAGNLSFLVEFICTVDDKIEYSWHSNIFDNIKVLHGMNNSKNVIERESDAIAGINSNIGNLDDLNTADKSNLVEAINSVDTEHDILEGIIGNLDDLNTADKSNLVEAINSINTTPGEGDNVIGSGYPHYFAVCRSTIGEVAKTANVDDEFILSDGTVFYVRFNHGLSATLMDTSVDTSLNINGTGAKAITFSGDRDGTLIYDSEVTILSSGGILPLMYSEENDVYVVMNINVAYTAFRDSSGNDISGKFNELDTKIGDLNKLEVDAKDNLVDAANLLNEDVLAIFEDIGDMLPIEDMGKNNLSEAIIELYTQIGNLDDLATSDKTSLVEAINELDMLITVSGDTGSLGGVTGGSSVADLTWQNLETVTLTEDIKTYTYTLPEKCKGMIVDISVPKDLDMPATTFNIKDATINHWQMDQGFIWGKTGATSADKVLRVCCKPENGYYSTTYADNSGSHPHLLSQRWTGSGYLHKYADTAYVGTFNVSSSATVTLPTGTIIKIWGLIE